MFFKLPVVHQDGVATGALCLKLDGGSPGFPLLHGGQSMGKRILTSKPLIARKLTIHWAGLT